MNRRRVLASIVLIALCTAPGFALDTAPSPSPASPLMRIADREQSALEERGIIVHDPSLTAYLQGVADRLWRQMTVDLAPPVVEVIADSRIEACAYPNGRCYLSTGMLDILENENQLAMILAHEIIHYARRHTTSLYRQLHNDASERILQDDHRSAMNTGHATLRVIDAAERQADREGLSLIKAAGYHEADVLPLMSVLIETMSVRHPTVDVNRLIKRAAFFKKQVVEQPAQPSAVLDEKYLDRIAPALIANAQTALRCGDWDRADRSISRFMIVNPEDARAYYLRGEVMRRRKDGDRSRNCIGSYLKAIELDPNYPPAHRALGELYYKAGRYQLARPHFETFLSLAPQDSSREFIIGYLRQCQN